MQLLERTLQLLMLTWAMRVTTRSRREKRQQTSNTWLPTSTAHLMAKPKINKRSIGNEID